MARASSTVSEGTPEELRVSKGALDQRWPLLSGQLGTALGFNVQQLRLEVEHQAERVWVGLQGSACEYVVRNRGGTARVVPLCPLPKALIAWLGLQEDVKTGPRPFVFRQIGVTIHFGFLGDPIKPQVLRLEWPGVTNWTGAGVSFQSTVAGHPHWQIDILQSLSTNFEPPAYAMNVDETVEEFGLEVAATTFADLLRSVTIEDMHLASAARWWLPGSSARPKHHLNAPPDIAALSRWLIESVQYVRQELARCALRT